MPNITVSSSSIDEFGAHNPPYTSSSKLSVPGSAANANNAGSARARLSSIEPVRGGAAYERMLLAGTGMRNVVQAIGEESEEEEGGDDADEEAAATIDGFGGYRVGGGGSDSGAGHSGGKKKRHTKKAQRSRTGSHHDAHEASEKNRLRAIEGARADMMDEDEDVTLLNIEEMLEDFEWNPTKNGMQSMVGSRAMSVVGLGGAKTADLIEARLLDELQAIEAANIHALIESDDRVAHVIQHIEEALGQLDVMDSVMSTFKASLNARNDDIMHIESQNRGLQVQTSNQRVLADEIEKLLQTIHVDDSTVAALEHASLETAAGIADLEAAAASLYKSILQAKGDGEDGNMAENVAAATERLAEYISISDRFCKRVLDFLTWLFNREIGNLLSDPHRQYALQPPHPTIHDHSQLESSLEGYCGILLYIKETSPSLFSRISAQYFASVSDAYRREMTGMLAICKGQIRKATEEENNEISFVVPGGTSAAAVLRAGTVRRVGMGLRNKPQRSVGEAQGGETFARILSSTTPLVTREQAFIADFLHIKDNNVTYADYCNLEPFFRRRAATLFTYSAAGPMREMKGAMDLIFGFLAPELQTLADHVLQNDRIQLIGILAALDRAIIEAEEASNDFLIKTLSKLYLRLTNTLEKLIAEQIKNIEQTRLSSKKRKGVLHFVKVLPLFVERVEAQLVNSEMLNIRGVINGYYQQLSHACFEALQAMAKMALTNASSGGNDDEKGVLYSQILLLENTHYLDVELRKVSSSALSQIVRRAESMFNDSLGCYVASVLRRPFGKLMDFGDAVDLLLRSTPANEITFHAAYSKSAFKRLAKENTSKDVRKNVETLSKRVQKHFAADDDELSVVPGAAVAVDACEDVMVQVWRSCEAGAAKELDRFARILKDVLPDGSVTIEITMQEIRRLFTANAPSIKKR
ncbi:hypothetical protein K437DRAFT_240402 [Tilletiaria anomala UBC 951]|uniref:Uncharacterized protein n=1 Tax=Tilletiaria anomala (strain ATCC 24038 / CBS 436.72 / UBC 951) TaxID=1037660 RepID=A0A066VHA4_TILAU|nr:uncharacterized protein K437DRAFT_240402 [Tilletiaria anomala UBC 951]KDN37950.1 hypothetical protein K437DRAFT_240402 [Tilletiaria anomala UBC 951]